MKGEGMVKTWFKNAAKNWKPLAGGIVAGVTLIVNTAYPFLPPEYQAYITGAGIVFAALFQKQKNVTGGDVPQVK
jgi:hypothetical protein